MLDIFEKIIDASCRLGPQKGREGKSFLELTDNYPEGRGKYQFKIKDVPEKSLLVKIEEIDGKSGNSLSRGDEIKGLRKRADYAIISERKNKGEYDVIILEITSGNSKDRETMMCQLKGARALLDYYDSLAWHFLGERFLDDKNPEIYYVVICPIKKGKVHMAYKPRNQKKHTEIEEFLKIPFDSKFVFYRQLVS